MDMESLMAQAKQLQDKVAAAQELLGQSHVKGIAGNGECIVDMTGKYDITGLTIRDDVLARGATVVAQVVMAALQDAKSKADATIDRVMGDATAGMPMPE